MLLAEQFASLLPVFLGLAPCTDNQGEALPADWSVVTSTTVTPQVGGFDMLLVFTRGLRVLSLPASVCVSVCQSVCQSLNCPRNNSRPVQVRLTKFGPKVQNDLVKVPKVLWSDQPWPSRSTIRSKSKVTHFELVRTITPHPFKLGSPNLDQRCKIHGSRSL